jgi:hypothetical protein
MEKEIQLQAAEAVEKIQSFDPKSLARKQDLGERLAFSDAVSEAEKLIDLYCQIPIKELERLPNQQADHILQFATGCLTKFEEISNFDPTNIENPSQKRDALIDDLRNMYVHTFDNLYNHLAYLGSRQRDFGAVEAQARSALALAQDTAKDLASELNKRLGDADGILEAMKQLALEQGVSHQGIHFSSESTSHEHQATTCRGSSNSIWRVVYFHSQDSILLASQYI